MNWLKLALLIIGLLRDLRDSNTLQELKASPRGVKAEALGDGTFLTWLWENREQIMAFANMIFGNFGSYPPPPSGAPQTSVQDPLDHAFATLGGMTRDFE